MKFGVPFSILASDFKHDRNPNYVYAGVNVTGLNSIVGLLVAHEGSLTCKGSTFRSYDEVAKAQGSNVSVTITGCEMAGLDTVAHAAENASLIVTDNVISSGFLIASTANVNGRVEFLRNKLSASTKPIILVDRVSKKPTHDVKDVIFFHGPVDSGPSVQERSKHTAEIKKKAQEQGRAFGDIDEFGSPKFKHCDYCLKREDSDALQSWINGRSAEPARKFRHCSGCHQLCYCSKECQLAHWPDHKLACRSKDALAEDRVDESRDMMNVMIELARRENGGKPISSATEELLHFRVCGKCRKIEDHDAWRARLEGREAPAEKRFGSCGRCSKVFYCSKKCQRSHWPDHRAECKNLRSRR